MTARLVHGFDFVIDLDAQKVKQEIKTNLHVDTEDEESIIDSYSQTKEAETKVEYNRIEDEVTFDEPATEKFVTPVERTSTIDTKDDKDWMLQKLGLIKPEEKVREVVNVHADVEHEVAPIHRPGEFFPVKVTRRQSLALRQVIDYFALQSFSLNNLYIFR